MTAQEKFNAMLLAMMGDDAVDALINEVYGKPGLGVEDSAGLVDYDGEASDLSDRDFGSIEDDHDWIRGGC